MTEQTPQDPQNPPDHPADAALPAGLPAAPSPSYGQPPVPYGGGYPPMQVAPKSPGLALLAAFFVPGLGSLINGDVGKGIGILIGYAISWVLVIVVVGLIGVLGFWIWGMVDAYSSAKRWNLQHGIIS